MKNLEQIRSNNAYTASLNAPFRGKNGGDIVKKIPTMIIDNGILLTLAYALEQNEKGSRKNIGEYEVFEQILAHLSHDSFQLVNQGINPEEFLEFLSSKVTTRELREITSETIRYLNYFRRFAGTKGDLR